MKFSSLRTLGLLLFAFYFLSSSLYASEYFHVRVFDFSSHHEETTAGLSVEKLVKRALEFGLDSREKIQMLFQARNQAKVKLGEILPQVNVTSALSSSIDASATVEAILPLVGFLFPSRWFDWRSSKKLADAEEASLATLFADRAQAVQQFYFDVQMQIWSIRVLEFYIDEIENILSFLNEQAVSDHRRATDEDVAVLENIRAELAFTWAYADNLSALIPEIASAIGLNPHVDWATLTIEPHTVVMMGQLQHREYEIYFPIAIEKSTELRSVHFLTEAAKRAKTSTYFDFFDPQSGNNLGFGYGYRIKIARSNLAMLEIQRQRTEMQIAGAIQGALNNYNDSVNAFPELKKALESLPALQKAVEDNLNDTSRPLDINKFVRFFNYANGQALRYVQTYFIFREAEANLDRYTWNGKIYDMVSHYKNIKQQELVDDAKQSHSFRTAFKKKIKKMSRASDYERL